jgi:hypothetical protein
LGDQLRILFFDDLRTDPRRLVTSLCSWLDVDVDAVDAFSFPVENKTEQYRSRLLQRGALEINRRSEGFFRRHPALKSRLRTAYYSATKPPHEPGMSASARARLEAFYAPHNDQLAGQLASLGLVLPSSWSRAGAR